jgi:glycosyltransferase involved in cell wall biosynthesis
MSAPLVLWHAPFLSGGGYCSEAVSFAQALVDSRAMQFRIVQHGDAVSGAFVRGLSETTRDLLARLFQIRDVTSSLAIAVCHSEPGAWSTPQRLFDSGAPCPPPIANVYTIGRTMFETDRLPAGWLERLRQLDEIWVPTEFSRRIFLDAGVDADKVFVIGEAVDTDFFDRARVGVDLPRTALLGESRFSTVFCFVGKWELRKNIRTLVRAFVRQFAAHPSVALAVLTQQYHSDADFREQMTQFIVDDSELDASALERVLFFSNLDERQLPGFFVEADAFVTATHGEGFGRPIVEAMSMSLPVIAPFWSGMTAFLTEHNSFPIAVDELERVGNGPFADHQWATVSERLLGDAMRIVHEQPELARRKGAQARADVVRTMCLECIAKDVESRIEKIQIQRKNKFKDEI